MSAVAIDHFDLEGMMSWRRFVKATGVILFALVLAAISGSLYQRRSSRYVSYSGIGSRIDSMRVVVGGWPVAYLADKPYAFSPANAVDFSDGLLGIDGFDAVGYGVDVMAYGLAIGAASFVAGRLWRSNRRRL